MEDWKLTPIGMKLEVDRARHEWLEAKDPCDEYTFVAQRVAAAAVKKVVEYTRECVVKMEGE